MTWTRVRRWIGEHPERATTLLVAALLFGLLAAALVALCCLNVARPRLVEDNTILVGMLACNFGLCCAGWITYRMTLLLGRAGLKPSAALAGAKYFPLLLAPVLLLGDAVFQTLERMGSHGAPAVRIDWSTFGGLWPVLSLLGVISQICGYVVGALVVRRRLRRGLWETTRPAAEKPPRWQRVQLWANAHPAWAANLAMALFMAVAWVAILFELLSEGPHGLGATPSWRWLSFVLARSAGLTAAALAAGVFLGLLLLSCERGRAGLSLRPMARAIVWSPAVTLIMVAVLIVAGLAAGGGRSPFADLWSQPFVNFFLRSWRDALAAVAAAQAAGWLVVALVAWLMRRSGKWPPVSANPPAPPDGRKEDAP